jgi:hypothetical protein
MILWAEYRPTSTPNFMLMNAASIYVCVTETDTLSCYVMLCYVKLYIDYLHKIR